MASVQGHRIESKVLIYRFSSILSSVTMQGKTSHKFVDPNENFLLRLYYQKDVLTVMCFGNEMFYAGLYLLNFTTGPTRKYPISSNNLEMIAVNVLIVSVKLSLPFDVVLGISLFKVLTILAFPVAVAKAGSSLLQAYVAAQNIVIIDQTEREEKRRLDAVKKPE